MTISDEIGFCADCIRADFDNIRSEIKKIHDDSRKVYGLPKEMPATESSRNSTNGLRKDSTRPFS